MTLAFWCVLIAALMPYGSVAIAKARSPYDNRFPRAPGTYRGLADRAFGAHQNGFEAFPFFAVAVLVASGGSSRFHSPVLDGLALAWVVLRLFYLAAYLLDRPGLRTFVWTAALLVSVAIFTLPAWRG